MAMQLLEKVENIISYTVNILRVTTSHLTHSTTFLYNFTPKNLDFPPIM